MYNGFFNIYAVFVYSIISKLFLIIQLNLLNPIYEFLAYSNFIQNKVGLSKFYRISFLNKVGLSKFYRISFLIKLEISNMRFINFKNY